MIALVHELIRLLDLEKVAWRKVWESMKMSKISEWRRVDSAVVPPGCAPRRARRGHPDSDTVAGIDELLGSYPAIVFEEVIVRIILDFDSDDLDPSLRLSRDCLGEPSRACKQLKKERLAEVFFCDRP